MRLLAAAGYRSMPWRNGKGMTREIARAPEATAEFDWRLSLASLSEDGPFSNYEGYERAVVLVEGEGFTLDFGADDRRALTVAGAHAIFDGGQGVRCHLVSGPCRDLSLMVRLPGTVSAVRAIRISAATAFGGTGVHRALYVLAGACRVAAGDAVGNLGAGDTLLLRPEDAGFAVHPADAELHAVLLEWLEPTPVAAKKSDSTTLAAS